MLVRERTFYSTGAAAPVEKMESGHEHAVVPLKILAPGRTLTAVLTAGSIHNAVKS